MQRVTISQPTAHMIMFGVFFLSVPPFRFREQRKIKLQKLLRYDSRLFRRLSDFTKLLTDGVLNSAEVTTPLTQTPYKQYGKTLTGKSLTAPETTCYIQNPLVQVSTRNDRDSLLAGPDRHSYAGSLLAMPLLHPAKEWAE